MRPKTSREAPGAAGLNLGRVPEGQEEALLWVKARVSSTSQPEVVTEHLPGREATCWSLLQPWCPERQDLGSFQVAS